MHSDNIREQNILADEIANAIAGSTIGEPIDDIALEEDLENLMQEKLDEQMLDTGSVPVADVVHRMPTVANGEGEHKSMMILSYHHNLRQSNKSKHLRTVKNKKVSVEEDEEEELRKLQAEMAM
jgi:charged multivesicular body protein 4A/B